MSYLKFDKEQLINLEYSLYKEVLRSNRAGSYINTTLNGCNTRKYHGLLVCPVKNFKGEKHVLLSSLDETIIQNGSEFNLGIHRYKGGTYEPKGHKYIREIEFDKVMRITYRVGSAILNKERILVEKKEQVLIRYSLHRTNAPTTLRFKPFLAFRNIHNLSYANMFASSKFKKVANGISIRMYDNFPELFMQFNKNVEFIPAPDWYYNIEYLKELNRGYDYLEDLLVPGYFEVPINTDETIIFSASTEETNPVSLKQRFTKEIGNRASRATFINSLKNAAEQFVMYDQGEIDIVAGFPWYNSITRQTFISLPGIYCIQKNIGNFKKVLDTYIQHLKNGFFPDEIKSDQQTYNSADTSLWFIWAIQQYFKCVQKPRAVWRSYGESIKEILNAYRDPADKRIGITREGLIYNDSANVAHTWMNSYAYGNPAVKRNGLAVEVNALWFNAICFSLDLADMVGDEAYISEWKDMVKKVGTAFNKTFWNDDHKHLADVVKNGVCDWSVRPNMVIATALDYSPLSREQQKLILGVVKKKLLTTRGLRTLSPDHIRYKGQIKGGPDEREAAAHQGTVYPWLIQFFVEGYLKIHKKGGIPFLKQILEGFEDVVKEHGIGTISEMYNGNPPHTAKGAISQAWNVAGVIFANHLIQNFKD
jgi:predicted glycogen debranching enzyme